MRSAEDLTARARIRETALARFTADGFEKATLRAIAADAGVSPALVVHHFGSKDGLRAACDDHVVSTITSIMEPWFRRPHDLAAQPSSLVELFADSLHLLGYVGRALVEGGERADGLVDRFVDLTEQMLADAQTRGAIRPSDDPRARAAVVVLWDLVVVVLGSHLARALGEDDMQAVMARYGKVAIEIYTNGMLSPNPDDRRTT